MNSSNVVSHTKSRIGSVGSLLKARLLYSLPMNAVPSSAAPDTAQTRLALARSVLDIEAQAVSALANTLGTEFLAAVDLILACKGRVVVSGIGKSGHIARKIAATFASTGTPAFFVHPAEASHGDLGMVTSDDVMVAFSNSGETAELLAIMPIVKRMGAKLIAITGFPDSGLAQLADVHLEASVAQEACPMNLAPTASTTAALALGDALAVTCLDARGFGEADFARSHPGGALGRKLLTRVADVMRAGAAIPTVSDSATVYDAILEMTKKGMGMVAVLKKAVHPASSRDMPEESYLAGIFTDGNLRGALEVASHESADIKVLPVTRFMSARPHCVQPDQLAAEALALMERQKITQLVACTSDSGGTRLQGVLNMQDLFKAKVV